MVREIKASLVSHASLIQAMTPILGSGAQQLEGARFTFLLSTPKSQHDVHTAHSVSCYCRKVSSRYVNNGSHTREKSHAFWKHVFICELFFSCGVLTSYVVCNYVIIASVLPMCDISLTWRYIQYSSCYACFSLPFLIVTSHREIVKMHAELEI